MAVSKADLVPQSTPLCADAGTPAVSLGCPVLDEFLRGGFHCGLITEITGEAATAKTQMVLQSLLTVQLSPQYGGLGGSAIYIYTDGGAPPVNRLQQLCSRFAGYPTVSLDNVHLHGTARTPEAIRHLLSERLEPLIKGKLGTIAPVRLIAIDSVANVFRDAGDGPQGIVSRAEQLFQMSAVLKRLAHQYSIAVLLTNQVMDDINAPDLLIQGLPLGIGSRAGGLVSSGRKVLPTLGLAWAHCINVRVFVARHDDSGLGGPPVRSMQVVFAPHLPISYCCFVLQHDGVWGLVEQEQELGGA